MIPIPSFNPLDTITYPDGNGVINVGAADAGSKILLYNETQANLDIDFYNGNQSILHAWEARYWTVDGDTKQLGWSINSELQMSNPPISLVIGELYGSTEKVEGNYPAPIIRQTSTGNPGGVQANVTQLVNTGAVSGTNVVTVNSTAAVGSTATLTNDGLFQLLVTIAGALVNAIKTNETDPILQLGALTHLVEVLGNLQVDGNINGAFTVSVNNVHGEFKAVPTGGLYFVDSGNNVRIACDVDNTFIEAGTGNVQLQAPAGTTQITVDPTGITMAEAVQVNAATTLGDTVNKQGATVHGTLTANNQLNVNGATGGIVDAGPLSVTGPSTFTGAATFSADPLLSTSKIADGAGNNLIDASIGGMVVRGQRSAHNRFTYQGDGTNVDWFINAIGPNITGSASATVNHLMKEFNVSTAPSYFIMNPSTAGGSQTFGFNTITATQVNVVIGASNSYSFKGCLL